MSNSIDYSRLVSVLMAPVRWDVGGYKLSPNF